MRIIKSGYRVNPLETPCICVHCKCQFYFRRDEARLIDDSRDGDYFRVGCPQCQILNSVSVKLEGTTPW
jgi:hypothetical protein